MGLPKLTRCLGANSTIRTLECSQVREPPFVLVSAMNPNPNPNPNPSLSPNPKPNQNLNLNPNPNPNLNQRWRGLCEAALGSSSLETFCSRPVAAVHALLASLPPVDAPLKGGMFAHHMHFDVAPAAFPPHERPKCPAALPSQRSVAELKKQLRAGAAASGAHFEGKLRQQRARPLYLLLTT